MSSSGARSMPCRPQHQAVELEVLADLEDRRVLQQRLEVRRAHRATGDLLRPVTSPKSKASLARRDGRAARSRPCRAPRPARSRRTRPAWRRGWSSRVSKASRPAARASAIQASSWGSSVTVCVLRAVDLLALRRAALARRAACGVVAPAAGSGLPPALGKAADALAAAVSSAGAAAGRSTGGGTSTFSPSAMRLVSVENSISRRKPSSASASGSRTPSMLDGHLDRHVVLERDEIAGETGLHGELGQALAALGLLDLAGAGEQRVEVAVLVDELGGGLDADARHARHVVGGVAGQRLHVDDLVGRHAEFLAHLVGPDGLVLHGVEHDEAGLDQLHEVLVGGDDGHVAAGSQHVAWRRWR